MLKMQKLPKMPRRLKMLKKLTFFRVQPRVRQRRPSLPPWAGQKRVGGGGPPRGASILILVEEAATHTLTLTWAGA